MAASPAERQPGSTFSHYRVLERVGRGGMGTVCRARDPRLARDVAIKVINPEVAADPDRIARFRREATIVAALNHPGIVVIRPPVAPCRSAAAVSRGTRAATAARNRIRLGSGQSRAASRRSSDSLKDGSSSP